MSGRTYPEETLRAILAMVGAKGRVLSEIIGRTSPGGILCATRKEIGAAAGCANGSVQRAMEELKAAGLCVRIKNGVYEIRVCQGQNRPVGIDN